MIIMNCGITSSGKTTFSTALALSLIYKAKDTSAIIISFDKSVPTFSFWLPDENVSPTQHSLGALLEKSEINSQVLSQFIITPKKQTNLGLLAYCLTDTPFTYEEESHDKIVELVRAAQQLSDFVILDCNSDFDSISFITALECSDFTNCILSADLKGVAYYKTMKMFLQDKPKYKFDEIRYLCGNSKSWQPVSSIDGVVNQFAHRLPEELDIGLCALEGDIFSILGRCSGSYKKAVGKVANAVIKLRKTAIQDEEQSSPVELSNERVAKRTQELFEEASGGGDD